jgi:hypothetical protein
MATAQFGKYPDFGHRFTATSRCVNSAISHRLNCAVAFCVDHNDSTCAGARFLHRSPGLLPQQSHCGKTDVVLYSVQDALVREPDVDLLGSVRSGWKRPTKIAKLHPGLRCDVKDVGIRRSRWLRDRVLRPSYIVYFETAFSSVRACLLGGSFF